MGYTRLGFSSAAKLDFGLELTLDMERFFFSFFSSKFFLF
jgi:hypothetical protein